MTASGSATARYHRPNRRDRQRPAAWRHPPKPAAPPPLALVAQSGVFQVGPLEFIGGLGKALDVGNSCDVDCVEGLELFEDDPQIEVIEPIHQPGQRLVEDRCGGEGQRIGNRVRRPAKGAFNGLREGVHAGGGRDLARRRDG